MKTWDDVYPHLKKIATNLTEWSSVASDIYVRWSTFLDGCEFCGMGEPDPAETWFTKPQWQRARKLYLAKESSRKWDEHDERTECAYCGELCYPDKHECGQDEQQIEWDGEGKAPVGAWVHHWTSNRSKELGQVKYSGESMYVLKMHDDGRERKVVFGNQNITKAAAPEQQAADEREKFKSELSNYISLRARDSADIVCGEVFDWLKEKGVL